VKLFTLILLSVVLYGCGETEHYAEGEIDALYWHERNRYTVISIDEDGIARQYRIPRFTVGEVNLHTNLDSTTKPWYKCEWVHNSWTGTEGACDIYIHNLDELGTADWNHGKFGSGSTTRID
jgi:hypothetical protein